MQLYYEQFSAKHNFNHGFDPTKYLVLATTPRSGSHMLGHSMYSTGRLGFPLEYANPANLKEWMRLLSTGNIDSTIEKLKGVRTSPNGVFSLKLHYDQLLQFDSFSNFLQLFPEAKFVLVSRRNLVKQAISYSIALQTEVWIDGQEGNGAKPEYSFSLINKCLRKIIQDNAAWKYLLSASGSQYIEIEFETVVKDMSTGIKQISDFIAEEVEINPLEDLMLTKPQTSGFNEEWSQRFISDYENQTLFPPGRKS